MLTIYKTPHDTNLPILLVSLSEYNY